MSKVITTQNFQPGKTIQNLLEHNSSGNLLVKSNSVTWVICFYQGKLQYAYHSLQSFYTIKNILQSYSLNETIKTILQQGKSILQGHNSVFSLVNQLGQKNLLNDNQKQILFRELTKDALEFFLWLTEAKYQLKPLADSFASDNAGNNFLIDDAQTLLDALKTRSEVWQQFTPSITSPYQRVIFADNRLSTKKIANGTLAPQILAKLAKVMNGCTIREIAIALKKNELRVIQLLLPYIKEKVIVLKSPTSPLDRLPTVPLVKTTSPSTFTVRELSSSTNRFDRTSTAINSGESTRGYTSTITKPPIVDRSVKFTNIAEKKSKKYKIVSIDDSPVMLEMICNYLGTEKYEVCTLENPMLSLGPIFDMKPDLILMDFSMPKINGNKLCRILRKSHVFQDTPIIMVSGNLKMTDPEQLKMSGITDCLAKPFTKKELVNIVEKHL